VPNRRHEKSRAVSVIASVEELPLFICELGLSSLSLLARPPESLEHRMIDM
jgi:hypothetical protein